jgi:hemerythrin-like domain-containing protein
MPEMSMNRVIHAAVRRDLSRFEAALQALTPGDQDRARQLERAWENFSWQLDHHHHGEHDIVWPALRSYGFDTAVLEQMDAEHELMAAALEEAGRAIRALAGTPDAEGRDRALRAVRRLHEVTVPHLEHEERELEPLLQGPFADSEQAAEMNKRLRAGGPQRAGTMLSWLADGAGPAETGALHGIVPAPARLLLMTLLGRSYRREVASVWR